MDTTTITSVSQFVFITNRDLGLNINSAEVRLGRLIFNDEVNAKKYNGYVCFYANYNDYIIYLKAFKGKTSRKAQQILVELVQPKMEFLTGHSFFAIDNSLWYFIKSGDDREILSEIDYKNKKKAAI